MNDFILIIFQNVVVKQLLTSTFILVLYQSEKVMWFGHSTFGHVNSRLSLISR